MNKHFCIQSSFNSKSPTYSQHLALESRLVFDGAVVATAVEAQNTDNNEPVAEHISVAAIVPSEPTVNFFPETMPQAIDYSPNTDTTSSPSAFPTAINLFSSIDPAVVNNTHIEQTNTIIVVDPRADNAAWLSLTPPANTQIMILDTARDGFQQVAELLQNRHDVTELHVLPWTQDNQQWLGNQLLTTTLDSSVSGNLMDWNDGLADHAALVFHGQTSMGTDWLNSLSILTDTQTSWSPETDFNQSNSTPLMNTPAATNLIFIDSAVQNSADIVSAIDANTEIIYLDASKDGLTQIADYLAGRSGIDSIQIISHGKEAALYLGNETLSNDNLASYAEQLATIGQSLTVGGDILLYGCELSKSTEGSQFVDTFSYLTQADVAASTDNTGAASKGGNWTLEYTTGTIEASILAASHYQDLLAGVPTTVTSVAITSAAGVHTTGDVVSASVVFSDVETVTGAGVPTLMLNVGGQLRAANYVSGSGTNTLVFNYTIVSGDTDANGISIDANSLSRDGGAINNIDFAATLYHPLVADNNAHQVLSTADITAPTLSSAVANGTNLTLTYNEIGSGLLTSGTPLTSNFIVTRNGGAPLTVTAVSVNHVAQTVDLTLGSVINATDTNILVSYTASGNALDIQDSAGNKVADLSNQLVANTMPTFDLNGGALLFNTPVIEVINGAAGTGGQTAGDIVLFENAITLNGQVIDVIVTTVDNTGITIPGFDSASGTLNVPLENNWFELSTNVTAIGGSSTIKFDFIKHGTYSAGAGVNVLLQNVAVNSYDVDNGQFQEFGGFSTYTVASNTQLAETSLASNFVHFADTTNLDNTAAPGTPISDQARVTALYKEIHSFQIKTGSTIVGNAYYYLDFSGGPNWNAPISYDIPTVTPLTTSDFTPTLTGTYAPNVTGSADTAQSLSVTVNGITYITVADGLTWSGGTWSLTIPPANILAPGIYDVVVDTGYGPLITAHTKDITLNELTIVNNPPVNTLPSIQTVNVGVQTAILGLSVTDINGNLAATQLSVAGGVIHVDPASGATIIGNDTATLTLSGTEAQIQAALATVNYTANSGTSNDTLTVLSIDTIGLADTDTMTINVNTAPTTVNDSATGIGGNPVTVNVVNNDSDSENNLDPTTVKIVGTVNAGDPLVVAGQGTWSVNTITGEITFTPLAGFTASPAVISYTVKDTGGLESAAATVTVTMGNPPIAINDSATGIGGNPVTVNVVSNDSDSENNLDPTTVKIVGTVNAGDPLVVAGQGTWSVNTITGEITFTPLAGFTASPTPIGYTVKDTGGLESAAATVTVTMNNKPIAVNDSTTGIGGNPVTVNVVSNDSDSENNLDPTTVKIVGTVNAGDPLVVAGQGTWSVNTITGEITFTPLAGFIASPTPIGYTVKDTGGLESAAATVTVTMNNKPIVVNDNATVGRGNPVTINVLNNDSDSENNLDPTTIKIVGTANAGEALFVAGEGTWSIDASTGAIIFTPIAGFNGNPTPISYTVKDTGGLESAAATVTVIVNDLPIAIPDINTATEGGGSVTGNIIANEAALGDRPTIVMAANQGVNAINIGSVFITAAGGILLLNVDGSYSYTPPPQGNVPIDGLTETFDYTIIDSNGDISSSVLTISVERLLGTSGSLLQLSNPPALIDTQVGFNQPTLFAAQLPAFGTILDLSLYIPSRDAIILLTGSLRDQVVLELKRFSFDVPSWAFRHTDPNEQLEFEASYPDGSRLPDWLRFNPKLLRFSGIPPKGAHDETVMVTARDAYGNEAHALFTVHVNKEQTGSDHKSLRIDLKLLGIPDKTLEKQHLHKEKPVGGASKSGLSERIHTEGKLGKLQESRLLLNSLKHL